MTSKNSSYRFLASIALSVALWCGYLIINRGGWVYESPIKQSFTRKISDPTPPAESTTKNTAIQDTDRTVYHKEDLTTKANSLPVKDTVKINQADSSDWLKLYGIGPFRAGRILRFRDALGGFVSVEQVGETYGLPDSVFQNIKDQLVLADTTVQSIHINSISYDSLYLHPYITKQMSYYILRYRREKGPIHNYRELKKIILEKDHQRLKKVKPYLNFRIYKN